MSHIATECLRLGHKVTGSDNQDFPPVSDYLRDNGIDFPVGYAAENFPPDTDLVVLNAFVKRNNPEVREALKLRVPIHSYASFLSRFFLEHRRRMVVAGSKGKSTNTAMLAHILKVTGQNPAYMVGADFVSGEKSTHLDTEAEFWVLEGDEYYSGCWDKGTKFVHYWPEAVCLTNLADEHLDLYPTGFQELQHEYRKLVEMIPVQGRLVIWDGDPRNHLVAQYCEGAVIKVGEGETADFQVTDVVLTPQASEFRVNGQPFRLQLPGAHNALNAAMASAMAMHTGLKLAACAEAMMSFQGLHRRQEVCLNQDGIMAYDEIAKNWQVVKHGLAAIRQMHPDRPITAVYRPNACGTSDQDPQKLLPRYLAQADHVVLMPPTRVTIPEDQGGFSLDRLRADIQALGKPAEIMDEIGFRDAIPRLALPGHTFVFYYAPYGNPLLKMLRLYLESPDALQDFVFTPVLYQT